MLPPLPFIPPARHGGSEAQALFARCWTRGAPIAVTLHGRKRLMYAFQTRSAVDSLLELWLAASLDASEARNRYPEGGETDAFAEVSETKSKRRRSRLVLLRIEFVGGPVGACITGVSIEQTLWRTDRGGN